MYFTSTKIGKYLGIVFIVLFISQNGFIDCQDDLQNTTNSTMIDAGTIKVGDSCKRDYQCIKNAYCQFQMTCRCEQYYLSGPDRSICHITSGGYCQFQENCTTMSNSQCLQGVCTCKDNFTLDINNSSNCIPRPIKTGDDCQRNDECAESLERAHCIDEKCRCYSDHRFINETGKCVQMKGIYQLCKYDYECFDEMKPNDLYCKDNECAYREANNKGISFGELRQIFILFIMFIINNAYTFLIEM